MQNKATLSAVDTRICAMTKGLRRSNLDLRIKRVNAVTTKSGSLIRSDNSYLQLAIMRVAQWQYSNTDVFGSKNSWDGS